MDNSNDDIISRSLRFISQQREMYGDFSTDLSSIDIPIYNETNTLESTLHNHPQNESESFAQKDDITNDEIVYRPVKKLSESELIEACTSLDELAELCAKSDSLKTDVEQAKIVFGSGNATADILIIGNYPTVNDEQLGNPFTGEAGELLDKILGAININRTEIYLTNLLKRRTSKKRQFDTSIISNHLPYLLKQIELINPKIILCVSKIAANTLLDNEESFNNLRSNIHPFDGRELMVTYHPALLLTHQEWKRPTWEDIQLLQKRYNDLKSKS